MAVSTELKKKDAQKTWFVLSSLVTRDFKLKYRRSVLGIVWSVLNPLLMMIVLACVFSYMFRFQIEHYAVYIILGQTLFSLMTDSTSGAMTSIIDAAPLIKKVRVEKMVFPVEKVLFACVNFCFSLVAVAAVMLFYQIMPTFNLLFIPLLLVYVILFCSGLGLLLATLAVFFRDVIHFWGVITTAWMYATPIIYPLELLPPFLINLMPLNPMYQYVDYFRQITMYGSTPSLEANLICLGMALITFAVGLLAFRKAEKKFILFV
ncbi:MAG: ABC transporter permease [Eggerthellaceae bacterium]|nr:ABC transporter permease [Eggerthellaceae bacterium]